MLDMKSALLKLKFENLNEENILFFLEGLLRERDLDKYTRSVTFLQEKDPTCVDATSYDSSQGLITFNMGNLRSLEISNDVDIYPIIYNHIVCMYELYLTVEKIFVEHLSYNANYENLALIKKMVEEFNKGANKESGKYFDIDDKDVKIFKANMSGSKLAKAETMSPLTRYIRLKALYDTIDFVSSFYGNSRELKYFYENSLYMVYNGYVKNGNTIQYPLYSYFSQRSDKEATKILKQFSWYDKDELRTLYNASASYSEKDRLIYGMPIDICEYNAIRKRV